jgi:hypothetical protein
MIATFVLTGEWQELPIDIWIEKEKLADRITEKTWVVDGFGALYDSICITAWEDNAWVVLVSDYTENNQTNDGTRADFIELNPKGRIELPWSKSVQALNRPLVMGQAWDIVKVIAR